MNGKIKILILGIIIILFFRSAGCFKLVDGPMKFHIEGLEEFFELDSSEESDEYIKEGRLDAYKREGILLIPFIKEHGDGCIILLQPYSTDSDYTISIEEISLTTSEGDIISYIEEYGDVVTLSKWSDSMILVNEFNKSEEWFYSGNDLVLYISASVKKGEQRIPIEITYNVTTMLYRGPVWQV